MADDSVEKVAEAQSAEEKPTGPTQITLRTNSGGLRQANIDPVTHKFVKKPKAMPETREVTRLMREFLNKKVEVKDDGTLAKSSKSILEQMMIRMAQIALNDSSDPKWGQNAIAATEWFHRRAHGGDPKSDAELGAMERAGVRIVVLTPPALPNQGELKPREQLKPSFDAPFIEGEIVEEKK